MIHTASLPSPAMLPDLSSLECALTKFTSVTPLECALTKEGGGRGGLTHGDR